MKVGILGSSEVGQTLAKAFLTEGHEVMIGTRNVSKEELVKWQKENPSGKLGSFADTAKFGDLIVLAVSGDAAEKVVTQAGKENFSNKIVIDTTNPIAKAPPENGVLKFFTSLDKSLMEDLQKLLPEAKFVKAFNIIGSAFMLGKVEAARAIEPLCILWCIPGFIRNQWTHAFKLLKL